MNKTRLLAVIVLLSGLSFGSTFHVQTTGQDSNDGSAEKPFATVSRAVRALREVRAAKPSEPVTISLGAGTHFLDKTISLTAADTTAPVVFEGAGKGETVVSGGCKLSGWRTGTDGRSWTVTIPEVTNGVELVAMHGWNISRLRVKSYDPETRGIVLSGGRPGYMRTFDKKSTYRLENVRAAYGEVPGEWYCDRATGLLSYFPLSDEDARTSEIIAPCLPHLGLRTRAAGRDGRRHRLCRRQSRPPQYDPGRLLHGRQRGLRLELRQHRARRQHRRGQPHLRDRAACPFGLGRHLHARRIVGHGASRQPDP